MIIFKELISKSVVFATVSVFTASAAMNAVLLLAPADAFAEQSKPLDDPWITFCLLEEEVEEVGRCIDGLPPEARSILEDQFKVRYDIYFEPILGDEDTAPGATIVCPDEFGDACIPLTDAVLSLGGSCESIMGDTVCELP